MSTDDHSRFDELMSHYLDASLPEAEERELLQFLSDEAFAARFHRMTQLDTEIAGLLAGSIRDEVMVDLVWTDLRNSEAPPPPHGVRPAKTVVPGLGVFRRQPKKRAGVLLALAAIVVGTVSLTALHFFRVPASAAPARIAAVRGEVYFIDPSGKTPLGGNQPFKGGTIKTVGRGSRATLALADGTQIELLGDTSFTAGLEAGTRQLFLQEGILRAEVARQPANAPLTFRTPEAVATVHGTDLAIIEERGETYLVVTQGAVALQRASGGTEVLISSGYYAHVEPDGGFRPRPVARLPKPLRDRILAQH